MSPIRPLSHLSKCTFTRPANACPYRVPISGQTPRQTTLTERVPSDIQRTYGGGSLVQRTPGVWRLRAWKPDPVTGQPRQEQRPSKERRRKPVRPWPPLSPPPPRRTDVRAAARRVGQLQSGPLGPEYPRRGPAGDREPHWPPFGGHPDGQVDGQESGRRLHGLDPRRTVRLLGSTATPPSSRPP